MKSKNFLFVGIVHQLNVTNTQFLLTHLLKGSRLNIVGYHSLFVSIQHFGDAVCNGSFHLLLMFLIPTHVC